MEYLLVIDKEGNRVTSLVEGINGDTMEELKEEAAKEFPDCTLVEDDGTLQEQLLSGDKLYVDGQVVDRPPHVPTEQEKLARVTAMYNKAKQDYIDEIMTARLLGDDATVASIQEEFKEYTDSYKTMLESGNYDDWLEGAEQ